MQTCYLNTGSVIEEIPARMQAIALSHLPMCRAMFGTPEFSFHGRAGIWRVRYEALLEAAKFEIHDQKSCVLEFIVVRRDEGMPHLEEFIRRFLDLRAAEAIPARDGERSLGIQLPFAAVIFHPAFVALDNHALGQITGLQMCLARAFVERQSLAN